MREGVGLLFFDALEVQVRFRVFPRWSHQASLCEITDPAGPSCEPERSRFGASSNEPVYRAPHPIEKPRPLSRHEQLPRDRAPKHYPKHRDRNIPPARLFQSPRKAATPESPMSLGTYPRSTGSNHRPAVPSGGLFINS